MAVKEKIRIGIKGYDHQLVSQSAERIVATAGRTGARVSGPVPLPTEKQIATILRAVHKYRDSREQFETRAYKRLTDIFRPSNKTVEAMMGLELSAGVEIEIKLQSINRATGAMLMKHQPITCIGDKKHAKGNHWQEDRYDAGPR